MYAKEGKKGGLSHFGSLSAKWLKTGWSGSSAPKYDSDIAQDGVSRRSGARTTTGEGGVMVFPYAPMSGRPKTHPTRLFALSYSNPAQNADSSFTSLKGRMTIV
jgi:hypothetical protein